MSGSRRQEPAGPVRVARGRDAADDLPDQSPSPARWKVLLLAAIVAAWVAFLIYCQAAG